MGTFVKSPTIARAVVNTYRVWLRYELFRGRLSDAEFQASEACLIDFIKARGNVKAHFADVVQSTSVSSF
jgi:hypothetical protein